MTLDSKAPPCLASVHLAILPAANTWSTFVQITSGLPTREMNKWHKIPPALPSPSFYSVLPTSSPCLLQCPSSVHKFLGCKWHSGWITFILSGAVVCGSGVFSGGWHWRSHLGNSSFLRCFCSPDQAGGLAYSRRADLAWIPPFCHPSQPMSWISTDPSSPQDWTVKVFVCLFVFFHNGVMGEFSLFVSYIFSVFLFSFFHLA